MLTRVLTRLQGFFHIISHRDRLPQMSVPNILRVLLPDCYHPILAEGQTVGSQCASISALILAYRLLCVPRLVTFYLTLYLDTFMAAFRRENGLPAGEAAPSELSMANYIGDSDMFVQTPLTPIAGVIARSIRLLYGAKFNLKNRPTDECCKAFVRECVLVSTLGNYLNVCFDDPHMALYIADRIAIIDSVAPVHPSVVNLAIAEYGVTFAALHPSAYYNDFYATILKSASMSLRGRHMPPSRRIYDAPAEQVLQVHTKVLSEVKRA